MADRPGPTLRRRKLIKELVAARMAAGMSVRQLAAEIDLQAGTVSKIENGKQAITVRNIKAIGRATGLSKAKIDGLVLLAADDGSEDWLQERRGDAPPWFVPYAELEADAAQVWTYTSELVHGLLQTAEYAEAVIRNSLPGISEDQLRRSVELRRARQKHLTRENPPQLRVVLNEAAIHRPPASEHLMNQQIRHLLEVGALSNVSLHVLPFATGLHPGMKSSFTLLRFQDFFADMDCVYLENEHGGVWQEQPSEVGRYTEIFERLVRSALSTRDTVALLQSLV